MKLNTAKAIVHAGKNMGLNVTLRETYSGRGMYGKTTAAVVVETQRDLIQSIALASVDVYQKEQNEHEEFVEDLSVRTDSMGKGIVVY